MQTVKTLAIGEQAPDFHLPGADGKWYSLKQFASSKVLVILFTCNHCPTAQAYEERIKLLVEDYRTKGVQVVAISPNSPLGLLYEELGYTDLGDAYEDMVDRALDKGFNFPYLYDGDNQKVSLQYGPVATPHAFVFDEQRRLTYAGRVDKTERPGSANAEDLRAAIDTTLAGVSNSVPVTKTFGCSIKWGWKLDLKAPADATWAARPVQLEQADMIKLRTVVENKGTGKLILINFWATWCGPCVLEYPNFLTLQRMYGARDFEFISVSVDKQDQRGKVLRFLEERRSGVVNYQYSGSDIYELIETVDTQWNGALPYTMLIAPGGEKVWAHQGIVDFKALKKVIVEHPKMGRYY
jgi:peroxiredoxin